MTLDKFGRHLIKHGKNDYESLETKISSEYMFYNIILNFQSNNVKDNYYFLTLTNSTHYSFPLSYGIIEKVKSSIEDILVSINDVMYNLNELINLPLELNDTISFPVLNTHATMFTEIVIKCPIKFENTSVTSEKAFYLQQ